MRAFMASLAWLTCGHFVKNRDGKVPLAWTLGYYALSNISYIYFVPVAQLIFSRAPASVNFMMIGIYYLSVFVGSTVSGRLGIIYERLSPVNFWLLHAGLVCLAGIVFILLAPKLRAVLSIPTPETVPRTTVL
jgi:proton-dependent oligopeptide transporter, POT family